MAFKRNSSVSRSRNFPGVFKWILKCLLTHIGCLSRQEFDEQFPSNEAQIARLIDCEENCSDSENSHGKRKNSSRAKQKDEVFVEGMSCRQSCDGSRKKSQDKIGGAMISLQNCTLQCADPGNGESYWVSFEEKSFSKGQEFKVYSGRMNGIGPRSGDKCVVKVFRRCRGTENLCRCEVKKNHKSKAMAKAFNELMHDKKTRIKITTLYWAHMDEVSKIKQLFFTGERKLTTRETVLFEEDLRVNDDKPGKQRELMLFLDCQGKQRRCTAKDLEAFAHFTYHHSSGELMLCGMDGVQDEDGFYLKTPVIHSRSKEYGSSDQGLQGILEVFSNHVCNDFCKDMSKPNEDLSSLTIKKEDTAEAGPSSPTIHKEPEIFHEDSKNLDITKGLCQPLEQDAVFSEGSYRSTPALTPIQGSSLSEVTESFSGYLEPSAPTEEDINEPLSGSTPPPYSSLNVANWLIHEYAENNFISSRPFNLMLPQLRASCLVNQMSFDSSISETAQSERLSFHETNIDLNANFPEGRTDISAASTSGCVDDCSGSDRTVSIQCERRQVRFSMYSDAYSTSSPSEAVTAPTTDSAIQMSTTTGGTSGKCLPESPPSYIDSEMATAWWIMRRNCLSQEAVNGNVRHSNISPTNAGVDKKRQQFY